MAEAPAARWLSAQQAADFAQRVLQVVHDGRLTSSYKLALLLSLIDVCMERRGRDADEGIPVRELASKMVDLYWQQAVPHPQLGVVLQQSATAGQAKIVTLIAQFRDRLGQGETVGVARAKILDPPGYRALVAAVEEQLYRYVLVKLQSVGGASEAFLYDLPMGAAPSGQGSAALFGGALRLLPGVAEHLVRFEPLLRPLIQQRWAQHIAGLGANAALRQAYQLESFLFGSQRIALGPVAEHLAELQDGRCFYCGRKVRAAHVDHFIPWSRYRDDGLENLVYADAACNERKHAYLAGLVHLEAWLERFRPESTVARRLAEIARVLPWEQHPGHTRGAATTAYLYASPATLFWGPTEGLHREDADAIRRAVSYT